jgi:hypothetical protein
MERGLSTFEQKVLAQHEAIFKGLTLFKSALVDYLFQDEREEIKEEWYDKEADDFWNGLNQWQKHLLIDWAYKRWGA